jgi:hypothetical protein
MSKLSWFGVALSVLLISWTPARADPSPLATEWQTVITSQILAFRTHDADAALNYAGDAFHQAFRDPQEFFLAIVGSGYSPIMESVSETYGRYKIVAPDLVLQEVKLTGPDQSVYEAIYQLSHESSGWRVLGVQLTKTQSIGI